MTNSSRALRQAVRLALATAAASTAPLALAQTAPAEQAAPAVQEVVVTGSRLLQQPNDISISPITSVSQEDIQKTGMVRTEDILGQLPQIGAEQNSGTSISASGTATVSLRNLGSQRTLVLVNNRRLNPGGAGGFTGNANAADINQIPAGLIERVDVLTGGASAVYGADAVAGVVNFVMNTHFQGVRISGSYGWNNHSNDNGTYLGYLDAAGIQHPPSTANTGQNRNLDFVAGSNFADGKGNATVYATYLHSSPAVGYQIDHSACTLNGDATPQANIHCGGSGTSAHGQWLMFGTLPGAKSSTTIADTTIAQPGGGMIPYDDKRDAYNYGALSYFQRQADRYTAGAFFHYDVNPHATVYTETMWSRNTSTAQYGPSGSFFNTVNLGCPGTPFSTPANTDPFIAATPGAQAALCAPNIIAANQASFPANAGTNLITLYLARRSVESGGRQDNYFANSIRQDLGVKGEINDVWSYDVYGQFGMSQLDDNQGDFLSTTSITNALQATGASVATATCQPAGCVPWNVWAPLAANAVTPAQLAYLQIPAQFNTDTVEYIADGLITGDLGKYGVKLPTARDGLSVAFGTQYRSESFVYRPDVVFEQGLAAGGAPSNPINGYFHVWEGYTEMRLPLIDDKPGAYRLSLDAGYRYSSYTLGFNTNTYKIGLEWAPIQDVRLRGGYNRAVRVPNIDELYFPSAVGAGGTSDPCWSPKPVLTEAQCALTGVSAARYGHLAVNSAAQINNKFYGNPSLTPETADTYTLGVVFQPTAIPNLVLSLDAYDIKINNTITSLSPTAIVYNCALGFDPKACGRITRSPGNESLWLATTGFVDNSEENVGYNKTNGLDVSGHYNFGIGGAGKIGINLIGTYVHEFILQTSPGGGAYDCVGHFGVNCLAPLPKWRHTFTADWGTPWAGLDITLRWRYIGSTTTDRSSDAPLLQSAYYLPTANIPAYNYLDLSGSIPVGSNVTLRAGVNNIADKNPPLILNGALTDCPNTTCNDNTWVGTYDTLGRYIFFNVTAQF